MNRVLAAVLALLVTTLAWPTSSSATVPIVEGEDITFDLSGYLRNFVGVQHIPYEMGPLLESDVVGTDSSVLRLQWRLILGEFFNIEVHNRFFWQISSDPTLLAAGLGLGSTNPPQQSLDLESRIIDRDTHILLHDVDRLMLQFYTEAADITVGRQPITWGRANLFVVSDIWTAFSPFEIDTSQKPGVDAVRVLTSVADDTIELDFLIAERGSIQAAAEGRSIEDLSGGARMTAYLEFGDVSAAVAKTYEEVMLLSDITWTLDTWTLRAEASWVFYDIDDKKPLLPRTTVGADWYGSDMFLSLEYHFNGLGTLDKDDYLEKFGSEELARGEVYFVGQHYLGAIYTYKPLDLLDTVFAVISNLRDPSVALVPQAVYRLGNDAEVSIGAYINIGESPEIVDENDLPRIPPTLNSEFAIRGHLYFVQLAGYF